MELGAFDVDSGHLGIRDDNALGVLASVELAAHGEAGFGGGRRDQFDDDPVADERLGARQFWLIKEMSRCSILLHLLVPGGRWLTTISRSSSLANFCSSRFHSHSRTREPLRNPSITRGERLGRRDQTTAPFVKKGRHRLKSLADNSIKSRFYSLRTSPKRPNRERDCLVGERTQIVNRIKSTLARLGIRNFKPTLRGPVPAKPGRGRSSCNRAHPGGPAAAAKHLGRATRHCSDHDRIRRCDDLPPSENDMVGPADQGMIGSGGSISTRSANE